MKAKFLTAMSILIFGAASAFAGPTGFNFNFAGPDQTLGTTANFTSNGATITAFGYQCSAPDTTAQATLSACVGSDLFVKNDGGSEMGLGLAGESDHEIGMDSTSADFVLGLDVSNLVKMGATSMTLSFGSVQPGESYAIFGYGSNELAGGGASLLGHLVDGQLVGNDGSTTAQVFSSTIGLNASDEFLVFTSPCDANGNPLERNGPCGSNVTLVSAAGATPEPGTIALFGIGLAMLGFATRKRWATQQS